MVLCKKAEAGDVSIVDGGCRSRWAVQPVDASTVLLECLGSFGSDGLLKDCPNAPNGNPSFSAHAVEENTSRIVARLDAVPVGRTIRRQQKR